VIVGQKRLYAARMAHNAENSSTERGANPAKYRNSDGAAGSVTRMTQCRLAKRPQGCPGLMRRGNLSTPGNWM